MSLYVWPSILCPENQQWSPSSGAARNGGRTLAGTRRMSSWAAGGCWTARLERVALTTEDAILTAQALDALLNGGVEPIVVPRLPGDQAPGLVSYVPFSDGSTFSDGSLFAGEGPYGVLDAAADAYDTTIRFTWPGDALRGGEDWSVETADGPNLHRLGQFTTIEAIEGGFYYEALIRTPLRAGQLAGAEMNFVNPKCTMHMTNAQELSAMLQINRYGFFDAEFVEA